MVWAQSNVDITSENEIYLAGGVAAGRLPNPAPYIGHERRFAAMGEQLDVARNCDENGAWTVNPQRITLNTLTVKSLKCECYGYNVTEQCKRDLAGLFTPAHPFVIPAQQVDIKYFPKGHDNQGAGISYSSDFTYALHNVTDFVLVWPHTSNSQTMMVNPYAKNLQLRVDGKLFPNIPFENTYGYRFYQDMMNASDLDNFYEADKEYADSLITPRFLNTNRYAKDLTSFLCTMQAERNNKGFFFDGIETGNQNVNIQIHYNGTAATPDNITPQVWFTRDTYWTLDNENGLKYWRYGTPPIYRSDEDPISG